MRIQLLTDDECVILLGAVEAYYVKFALPDIKQWLGDGGVFANLPPEDRKDYSNLITARATLIHELVERKCMKSEANKAIGTESELYRIARKVQVDDICNKSNS